MSNLILEFFNLLTFKFHNSVAILANNVVVIGMICVVGIVILLILAKIHFVHQTAFGKEWEGTIDSSPRDGCIFGPRPLQKLIGRKVLLSIEHHINDDHSL